LTNQPERHPARLRTGRGRRTRAHRDLAGAGRSRRATPAQQNRRARV